MRTTAKSCCSVSLSASSPERASMMTWPSGSSTAERARRLASISSTTRMRAGGAGHASGCATPIDPIVVGAGRVASSEDCMELLFGCEVEALAHRLIGFDLDGERALDLVLGVRQHHLVRPGLALDVERRRAARLSVDD